MSQKPTFPSFIASIIISQEKSRKIKLWQYLIPAFSHSLRFINIISGNFNEVQKHNKKTFITIGLFPSLGLSLLDFQIMYLQGKQDLLAMMHFLVQQLVTEQKMELPLEIYTWCSSYIQLGKWKRQKIEVCSIYIKQRDFSL